MGKKKYYAVVRGRRPGIYGKWFGRDGAQAQVEGFPGARFKGFATRADAAAFIRYLVSYDVQKRLALEQSHNPGRVDVYEDPAVRDTPIGRLKPMFFSAVPRPTAPYYPQVSTILQKHLNAALGARTPPAAALRAAQREVRNLMEELAP